MTKQIFTPIFFAKSLFNVLAFSYLAYLAGGLFFSYLGANPIEVLTHQTGEWGLHFLLLTLLITPLRRHLHWNTLQQFRRFIGLWSFAYLTLHFLIYILFDHFFDWVSIVEDVIERPYITAGFLALVLMLPLAITSLKYFQGRMKKNWFRLHKLIYPIAILGIVHYWWLVKADILWPTLYAGVLATLLADRIIATAKKTRKKLRPNQSKF